MTKIQEPRFEHDPPHRVEVEHHPLLTPLAALVAERERQTAKWGVQHHPDGTALPGARERSDKMREICDSEHQAGRGTWAHILSEEFLEALAAEPNSDELATELIEVAAVCVAWVEDIRGRNGTC